LPRFKELTAHFETGRESPARTTPNALPAKDRPICRAAHGCRATHLLTGGIRDFGPLMNQPEQTGGLVIQTVGQFLGSLHADPQSRRS
jgi:hypothetical protein